MPATLADPPTLAALLAQPDTPGLVARTALALLGGGWGAVAGALLPRAAYRLAVQPSEPWRAICPAGHPLRGWVGPARCPRCPEDAHHGPRARGLAAVGAVACAALGWAVGPRPELVVWLLAVPWALLLVAVDRAVHRLPDVLTLPLAAGTAALLGLAAPLPGAGGSWPGALLGGAALVGCYLALYLLGRGRLGLGDVKLALPLGIALGWYGWDVVVLGACCGAFLSGGVALHLLLVRRAGREAPLAMGPCMIAGTLAGLLLGGLAV